MNTSRQIRFAVSLTSEEVLRAIKAYYIDDIHIQALPVQPKGSEGVLEGKLLGTCGLDLVFSKTPTTMSREMVITRKHLSATATIEEMDPA
jgi:hypothetical protein